MNRKVLIALVVAALAAVGCAGTPKKSADDMAKLAAMPPGEAQRLGIEALQANDAPKARELFQQALAGDPNLPLANYNLGYLEQTAGNLDAASKHYETVLAARPDHVPTIRNLGKIYLDQQRYADGVALFEKAAEQKPNDPEILNGLATFYRLSKQPEKAAAALQQLLSRNPDNPEAFKNMALTAYSADQNRLAEFVSANAKKLSPNDPGIYNNLGLVNVKLGDRRLALANFRKAIELDPNFVPGQANIGALALSYRDYATAVTAFEKVVAAEPLNANAHLNLAWAYEGSRLPEGGHRTKDALGEFEKVLALVKDQPDAAYGIARAYAGELKDLSKAKVAYERYLALSNAPLREKATRELDVVNTRILAGAAAEKARAEAEEQKRREDEEARKKAQAAAKASGSTLDQMIDTAEAAESAAGEAQPVPASAPSEESPAVP